MKPKFIFDKEKLPVFTIKKFPKVKLKFPTTESLIEEPIEFVQKIKTSAPKSVPVIMKKNSLHIFTTEEGYCIGADLNGVKILAIPRRHLLLFDKTNKKIKLFGKKAKQGWINIKNT